MCSHSSPDRERRTVPLKRSTADSSIYAGPRWDSATSRITSRGVCSSPVASDRFYTLNYDEPRFLAITAAFVVLVAVGWAAAVGPWAWWVLGGVVLAIIAVAIYDLVQT